MDIAATICDIAGANLPELAQSKSLMPVICNNASRDVAHSEWKVNASRCGVELELRTVRTKTAKLTECGPYEGDKNHIRKTLNSKSPLPATRLPIS